MPSITLKKNRVRPIACGHPWIFSGAIYKSEGLDDQCDQVLVKGPGGEVMGHGFYSPKSEIRVRLYERTDRTELEPIDVAFFKKRIEGAVDRRARLGLPGEKTTGFRLINSEGDGLPGVTVDKWGDLVVFQLTTRAPAKHGEQFARALAEVFGQGTAIFQAEAPRAMADREGIPVESGWHGDQKPEYVEFLENGLTFQVHTEDFQKTGHYADMRLHRRWFAEHCRGRRVLDAYSYTGAFGLLAALEGAQAVTCVDSSAPALERLAKNAELNGIAHRVEAVESKVDDFLRSAYDRELKFDAIVLDPPKLAPRKKHVKKALKLYRSLTLQALRLLEPGGIIALGSCSEAIGPDELERVFANCCARDELSIDTIYRGTQSPDHPVPSAMPEGRYLSFIAAQKRL